MRAHGGLRERRRGGAGERRGRGAGEQGSRGEDVAGCRLQVQDFHQRGGELQVAMLRRAPFIAREARAPSPARRVGGILGSEETPTWLANRAGGTSSISATTS